MLVSDALKGYVVNGTVPAMDRSKLALLDTWGTRFDDSRVPSTGSKPRTGYSMRIDSYARSTMLFTGLRLLRGISSPAALSESTGSSTSFRCIETKTASLRAKLIEACRLSHQEPPFEPVVSVPEFLRRAGMGSLHS
ncbi:hypothetical protein CVT24_006892 [Panaeolus cyanescens]|uniref:Uncharacterized protein n=1 Tax=Panaeolus cyanescens TaxID=181874 RepID=A0A409W037_9AGAR|nr:hypothetical protein CVT24_006892 [Panaeolus cyanescens]